MAISDPIMANACTIIDGIAFEVVTDNGVKKLLANDLYNPNYKASFAVIGGNLVLSVSSFREQVREQAMLDAVRINGSLLLDEVQNA